ncbi:hypothetical protein [Actinomadura atramentaria]|uniref:hypothetical protein n=1 Tax=Actinomadura atramentaria TaxID=1990 RepID=UPI000374E063|nr:hypothetical protein [Actinomadura atramentaria]
MSEPVIDPEVPERRQRLLLAAPDALFPPGKAPRRPLLGGRTFEDGGVSLLHAPVWVVLPALAGWFHGLRGRIAGAVAQVAVVVFIMLVSPVVWFWTGAAATMIAFLVLFALCGEGPVARAARELHGRYVRPDDLGGAEAALVRRAQTAVATVLGSAVQRQRLLDDVRNTVTLPAQTWDIAQTLAKADELRKEHAATPLERRDAAITQILAAQSEALSLAAASVTRRVEALEDYAARVRDADDALHRWTTAQRLSERGDAYQDLLARTVRDEIAVDHLRELTEEAARVERALRSSVSRARAAGLVLAPDLAAAS